MKQKTLFEIPIYAMSEKEFNKRWDRQKTKMYDMFINGGYTEKSAQLGISSCCFPRCIWKYNQIVGYIVISVSRSDVWFDIYRSLDDIYYADSKCKHFIQNIQANGTHFYAADRDTKYIKNNILKWLKCFEKDHLKKSFFVDYATFNNIFEYVDIKQIMKSL